MRRQRKAEVMPVLLAGLLVAMCLSQSARGEEGKIPLTTSSDQARAEYIQGRELAEKLQLQNSLGHFEKAVSLDPGFAMAELGWATSSQTQKDFLDHLGKAVQLSGKASEGERLLILANDAQAKGDVARSGEYFVKLVAAFPNDERAQTNLGNFYYGQQEFEKASEHYQKATKIAPDYSPAYNTLGYTYRQLGRYEEAGQAFKKYIELIPNDPNPYDSYGELLLKMGKFDESIASYQKALAIDPTFFSSRIGIPTNKLYLGRAGEAIADLEALRPQARSDGERRAVCFTLAVFYADGGDMARASQEFEKEYAIAEKMHDPGSMSNDLLAQGAVMVAAGKYDQAKTLFDRSLEVLENSPLSKDLKNNVRPFYHYSYLTVELGKQDLAAAKVEVAQAQKDAAAGSNAALHKQAHQLAGMLALSQKDYDMAVAELEQADHQNCHNLYRLALAYKEKGDLTRAKEYCTKAAHFNSLPGLDYAFIRQKAEALLKEMKS